MSKLIVANWKMNPSSESEAVRLAKSYDEKGVVICPPFTFLSAVRQSLRKADLGAQDVFWENPIPGGAFTGEVSISMLKKIGASYIIIGHSERRKYLGETDEMINKKVLATLGFGLKLILCVGESLSVKKEGFDTAKNYIKKQLRQGLKGFYNLKPSAGSGSSSGGTTQNLIVAYEPIWAIGTGKPDNPADSAEMAKFIKNLLSSRFAIRDLRVVYGGSVTSSNAERIFEHSEIDGALVGGASLKAEEFKKIIRIGQK
ncbi:MAG: triose-phosphate isomerase [Patescibacteria group bacterium]